jgi:hypothetical protein
MSFSLPLFARASRAGSHLKSTAKERTPMKSVVFYLRWAAIVLAAATAGCTGSVHGPSAESVGKTLQADSGGSANGYIFVDADGTSDPNYSSRTGALSFRARTGDYLIYFPGASNSAGDQYVQGSAQVTARGPDNTRCYLAEFPQQEIGSPAEVTIEVLCNAPDGTPSDSAFEATFLRRTDLAGVEGGYLMTFETDGYWLPWTISQDSATDAPFMFPMGAHWNSTGQDIILQKYGVGVYLAIFQGQSYSGGTAQVTAFDILRQGHYCEVEGWWPDGADQDVWVGCFDTQGNFADTGFSLVATSGSPVDTAAYTYAWADDPTAPSSYVPDTWYQAGFLRGDCTVPTSGPVTIEPLNWQPGSYLVNFPSMTSLAAHHSAVTVSAYGSSGEYCKIVGWGSGSTSSYATVECYDYTGQPAPAYFTIAYSVDEIIVC